MLWMPTSQQVLKLACEQCLHDLTSRENKDFPYLMIKDRIGIEELDTESLKAGEGMVTKLNGDNVAACRDGSGRIHCVSAICPHLGCIVAWNEGEQTWDCPCHGSRFEADGTLIAGPAEQGLSPV